VVVVEIHGYTTLSGKLDPGEALDLLTDFLAGCTRIVFEHGGAVDRYVGDRMTAFWNAPVPAEKHADLALEAALAICRTGSAPLERHGLRVGVGICSGRAVIGAVGEGPRRSYTVVGEAVSVASQLCALAPSGVILIAEPTMRLLTLPPHAQQIQPLRIKGFETPLTAYAARPPQATA
jgi:adenylate cyclase